MSCMFNVDVTFNTETEEGATGVITRDTTGSFVTARSFNIENALDVLMAEAYAAIHGLFLAQQMGHHRIDHNKPNYSRPLVELFSMQLKFISDIFFYMSYRLI